jgi:hypothetical protein
VKTMVISMSTVLILITLSGLTEIEHSFASALQSVGQQNEDASSMRLRSQTLSKLQARIEIVSQQISTLQAQIAATEAVDNACADQLQRVLARYQPGNKAQTKKGTALPMDGVGFRQTPIGATFSINGASIALSPASLSIKGVQQIVLEAKIIHFKSPLLQLNEGNRPLAGLRDRVAGVLAYTPMGIPIPDQYLEGHIVTGSTSVLVP